MKIIIEIRKGAGGDESALFCDDLMRVYLRYAQNNNIVAEVINDENPVTISLDGKPSLIKPLFGEKGVHRVQRVPKTETKGRIQTSTVTVAVLDLPEEKDVRLNESELRYETYRASGAGGQHRNTTDSAIRVIHIPTNTVVICASGRSQHKNKEQAKSVLFARLQERGRKEQQDTINRNRKTQVGSGDRSESIRTYNYQRKKIKCEISGRSVLLKDIMSKGKLELLY